MPSIVEGSHIGPYVIGRKLGEGGMGAVFEGIHEGIERRVAIKLLRSELASNKEVTGRFFNACVAKNLRREIANFSKSGNRLGSLPSKILAELLVRLCN